MVHPELDPPKVVQKEKARPRLDRPLSHLTPSGPTSLIGQVFDRPVTYRQVTESWTETTCSIDVYKLFTKTAYELSTARSTCGRLALHYAL